MPFYRFTETICIYIDTCTYTLFIITPIDILPGSSHIGLSVTVDGVSICVPKAIIRKEINMYMHVYNFIQKILICD